MHIPSLSRFKRPAGFALMIVLLFVGVSLILFASMLLWTSSNSRISQRNIQFNESEAAAESATETVLACMIRDYANQSMNTAAYYSTSVTNIVQTGWPVSFQFSDLNGTASQISVGMSAGTSWQVLDGPLAGQSGLVSYVTNTAVATPLNQGQTVPATVQQTIWFANIPLFQYAIFYNMTLEISPGNTMNINGHVHANGTIWTTGSSSSTPLTYSGNVDSTGGVNLTRNTNYDSQSYSTGNVIFTNGVVNGNAASLAMPIGTNNDPLQVISLLGLPPASLAVPNAGGYSTNGQVYLYNTSDLIISNNSTAGGTNFTVYYNNQYNSPQLAPIPPDVVQVTTNHGNILTNSYYSFVTNVSFYDYRESDTVQATQISVTNLNNWLTNTSSHGGAQYNTYNTTGSTSKGHGINSIYVYNSVPLTGTTLPAVRLVGGQKLPSAGLTVVTPQPLYVQGDYNTTTNYVNFANSLGSTTNGNTVPAALMGDSITILSSNWKDSYNANTNLTSRNPVATTVNAAALEGIVQSTTSANGTKYYSGGVENFLRLEENWSSQALTYNGSIVVLFSSQYATNVWQGPGNYYNAPNRQWGYDLTFSKGSQYLPPNTPMVRQVIRRTWAAW